MAKVFASLLLLTALASCAPALELDATPATVEVAAFAAASATIQVTNNSYTGPGSLAAAVAACPDQVTFTFTDFDIYTPAPIVVDCPNPITITGPVSAAQPVVVGSTGKTVGVAGIPFAPLVQPGITIVNVGGQDGLRILSDHVRIDTLGARGTQAAGYGDVAIRGADSVDLVNVALGISAAGGLHTPPATYRTKTALLMAVDSTNVRVTSSAAGWNQDFWGAVVFQNVDVGHFYRSAIVGASHGKPAVDTKDALTLGYGTSDFTVREAWITDNPSSSAVELHTADRVTIDDSTFGRVGRAGVTVYDARDVIVRDVEVFDAGTCSVANDDGGIIVYGGSQRVAAIGSRFATRACPDGTYRPVFKVLPGASGELR